MNGLTRKKQAEIVERIHAAGMTVSGWARVNEFNRQTVTAALYGGYGRKYKVTPTCERILTKLAEGGFYVR